MESEAPKAGNSPAKEAPKPVEETKKLDDKTVEKAEDKQPAPEPKKEAEK